MSELSPGRTLLVTGRGRASVEPDLMVLRFGVSARDDSYSGSVERLNEKVECLRRDLEAVAVNRRLLKTTDFHVHEDSRYDRKKEKRTFLGFVSSHSFRLELPLDREVLNQVLGRVAESASETSLRISFDVSDREELRRRAMSAAVADARRSAEVLSGAAEVSLGEILKIDYGYTEVHLSSRLQYDAPMALAGAAPDIEPEKVDAEQSVTITWSVQAHDPA